MKIREVMTPDPYFAGENDTALKAAQQMRDVDIGVLPVKNDDNKVTGIVTDRDLALGCIAEGKVPDKVRVVELMTKDPVTCKPDDTVESAVELMEQRQIRRLLVMDEDDVVGMVSLGDVAVKAPGHEKAGEAVEQISQPAKPKR